MNKEFFEAVKMLTAEKGIPEDYLYEKIAAAIMAMGVLFFAGCSKQSEVVKMGTNAAFPPFEYTQGTEVVGFDVTLSKLIAKDYGKELQVIDMSFDGLIAALNSGAIDFVAAGMTATEERRKNVDFSEPYYSSRQFIIIKKCNSKITCAADLNGKVIGVQAGTTGEMYVQDEVENADLKSFKNGIDASLALKNSAIDAIVLDELPSKEIVRRNPDLVLVEDDFYTEEYAIAVKKGNKTLLDSINKTIAAIKENGIYAQMTDAYMPLEGEMRIPVIEGLE